MNTPTNSEALPPTTGSPSSETPETDVIEREYNRLGIVAQWALAKCKELERERNLWRTKAGGFSGPSMGLYELDEQSGNLRKVSPENVPVLRQPGEISTTTENDR